MKRNLFCFFIVAGFTASAVYAGFIQPTEFPKVVADLSFVDRMALASAGYEPFESKYDDDGNCISGCSYSLPKWEDELAAMERWNKLVHEELVQEYGFKENEEGILTPPPVESQPPKPIESQQPTSVDFPPMPSDTATNQDCTGKNSFFANRDIPYGNPLGHMACISSPYGPRTLFGRSFHHGIDFRAATGTPVYSPANGVVKLVFQYNPSCGNGLVIEHSNGYATKYCHFDSVLVKKGEVISAGCLIGKTGNTGQSTGPHLHYSVLKNEKSVDPINFIEPGHKSCNAKK